jgi:hypothetical protein
VLATGDVGALRARPSESGILGQRMVHSTFDCDAG